MKILIADDDANLAAGTPLISDQVGIRRCRGE